MATQVSREKEVHLRGLASGDVDALEEAMDLREKYRERTGLDARTFSLVKVAALIALDAPPASYAWQMGNALAEGATADDIVGTLRAVAPQVGLPKVAAAATAIMNVLELSEKEKRA